MFQRMISSSFRKSGHHTALAPPCSVITPQTTAPWCSWWITKRGATPILQLSFPDNIQGLLWDLKHRDVQSKQNLEPRSRSAPVCQEVSNILLGWTHSVLLATSWNAYHSMPTSESEHTRVSQVKSLAKRFTAALSVVVINWPVSVFNQDAMSPLLNMWGSNELMTWLCFSPHIILLSLSLN